MIKLIKYVALSALTLTLTFLQIAFADEQTGLTDTPEDLSKPGIVKYTSSPVIMDSVPDVLVKYLIENRNIIRGIYLPGWKVINHSRIDKVIRFCVKNKLNTIVVDLKNAHGEIFFKSQNITAQNIHARAETVDGHKRIIDFKYLDAQVKKYNIKLIGRFVMFRDAKLYAGRPELRLQENETWVDLRKQEVIDYTNSLLDEAADLPVKEIVLDYIRFPDTSGFGSVNYKLDHIESIVKQASETVRAKNKAFSVYVFGWVAWDKRLRIGQKMGRLDPYVDVIYPMIYPSHFYPNSLKFKNPADHPYEIIERGYKAAVKRVKHAKIIPMLQIFWYKPEMVLEEIKSVYINDMPGYMCWNALGRYQLLERAFQTLDNNIERSRLERPEKKKKVINQPGPTLE